MRSPINVQFHKVADNELSIPLQNVFQLVHSSSYNCDRGFHKLLASTQGESPHTYVCLSDRDFLFEFLFIGYAENQLQMHQMSMHGKSY